MKQINLTGRYFGKLKCLYCLGRIQEPDREKSYLYWVCECECGAKHTVSTCSLYSGKSNTCGCSKMYALGKPKRMVRHGRSRTPEYLAWIRIRRSCYDTGNQSFINYGGRGITVCDRWKNSFEIFLADMGQRPSKDHSIDRINNNGNYEPGNCRWATRTEQVRNRRVTKMLEHNGVIKSMPEWAEEFGLAYRTMKNRVQNGWTMEKIANTPLMTHKDRYKKPLTTARLLTNSCDS